jgi:hypothetical protein
MVGVLGGVPEFARDVAVVVVGDALLVGACALALRLLPAAHTWWQSFRRGPQRLEDVLASNRRLEGQVRDLRAELDTQVRKLRLEISRVQARVPSAVVEDMQRLMGGKRKPTGEQ